MDKLQRNINPQTQKRPTIPTEQQPLQQQTPGDSSFKPQNEEVNQFTGRMKYLIVLGTPKSAS